MPGNFELIISNDDEVKHWLRSSNRQVNDMLYELVDATIFHAEDRLRAFAPGEISELVDINLPTEPEPGAIDGAAGVVPDVRAATFGQGLGSDPADYPYFVEVGTGVYSEGENASRQPITTIPRSYPMVWERPPGNLIFAWTVEGQKPQHYGRHSFEETSGWLPARIELARQEFAAETAVRSRA